VPTPSPLTTSAKLGITRLLPLVRREWKAFGLGLIALGGGAAINLLFPEIIRQFLQTYGTAGFAERSKQLALTLIALFAIQAVCFYFRSYLFGVVGQRVVAFVRARLFRIIIDRPIEFFDTNRTADLVSRLNSDCVLLQDAVSVRLSVFVRYSIQVIVGTILMAALSPILTVTLLVIVPLLVGLSLLLGRKLRRVSRAQQETLGVSAAIAQESFEAARLVRAFNREQFEVARYSDSNSQVLSLGLARAATASFFSSFVSFLLNVAIVGVLVYGVHLVEIEQLSIGDLTAFLLYGVIVAVSFAFLAGGYSDLLQSLGATDRVFEVLELGEPRLQKATRADIHIRGGRYEFNHVSFSYPSRPDIEVLHSLSLTIPEGKTTALVGPSGAGKSTIVNLMLGLYDPSQGEILVDGTDITTIDTKSLRQHIALVPQEQALFATTIAENLRYGKESASDEELLRACEQVNLRDFIESLPQGLHTMIGERGTQLSTGQKQRLAIARALLRDPKILILDEATSALDSENEHLVQQALSTVLKGRTAVVIAHRLATIKGADQVVVLEQGRLVQQGTHESLSRESGLYRQLVERQEIFVSPSP
jgi:ATP-binding cassette subfamily B protein